MRFLVTLPVILLHLANLGSSLADEPPGSCFSFDKKISKTLVAPIPLLSGGEVSLAEGQIDEKLDWGSGRAVVPVSISAVYAWLLDHTNWKDMSKTELTTKLLPSQAFLQLHEVAVRMNVFAFIHISWVEQWAYELLKGSKEKPRQILASYQKSSGTDYIKQLCGSVLMTKAGEAKTDVFFYEQGIASHYDHAMITKMHTANFKLLNQLAKSIGTR